MEYIITFFLGHIHDDHGMVECAYTCVPLQSLLCGPRNDCKQHCSIPMLSALL